MRNWLNFLKEKYGSIQDYLESIGITKQVQEKIRETILNK